MMCLWHLNQSCFKFFTRWLQILMAPITLIHHLLSLKESRQGPASLCTRRYKKLRIVSAREAGVKTACSLCWEVQTWRPQEAPTIYSLSPANCHSRLPPVSLFASRNYKQRDYRNECNQECELITGLQLVEAQGRLLQLFLVSRSQ